jgi:ABC-type phosphate/phosphonate transport system substrate-binding protein
MIASLPMYDLAELRGRTDQLWDRMVRAFAAEGLEAPPALDRARHHHEVWRDPGLFLSQTCGYPLMNELVGLVRVVATTRYRVPECVGSSYTSRVVVRADSSARRLEDLAGSTCAGNEPDSHSGMNAFRALVAPLSRDGRFFSRVVWSGGHRMSLEMVVRGEVDVAAIDCVTFALLERARPDLTGAVREVARTAPCPGLPLITAAATSDDQLARMRRGLERLIADPAAAGARDALLIDGYQVLPDGAYQTVVDLETAAVRLGYAALA